MLESLKGIDEIVIVDTGSIDDTVKIAQKWTDKVFTDHPWDDDFADSRNYALSKCTGDWVISIDGDEYLEVTMNDVLLAINKAEEEGFKTVDCNLIAEGSNAIHKVPRIFKRTPDIFWVGAIHEILNVAEKNDSEIYIRYGSSDAHALDPGRTKRILLKELTKNPNLVREKFYLAREYWYTKEYGQALQWYDAYLTEATWYPEKADAYLMAAYCCWYTGQGDRARDYCLRAIGHNPDFKEALNLMSDMHYEPHKSKWKYLADNAKNEDVLFIRS